MSLSCGRHAAQKLTDDNLCSIYENRIGFRFRAKASDGGTGTCVCSGPKTFVKTLPDDVRAQCCFARPELLEDKEISNKD